MIPEDPTEEQVKALLEQMIIVPKEHGYIMDYGFPVTVVRDAYLAWREEAENDS